MGSPLDDKGFGVRNNEVPEYLLRKYPFLRKIWERFWPFPELPPRLGGTMQWAIQQCKDIYAMQLTKEEKYLKWAEIVMDYYYKGLLTEEEKSEYLLWEFGW